MNCQDNPTRWQDVFNKTAADWQPHCIDIYGALYLFYTVLWLQKNSSKHTFVVFSFKFVESKWWCGWSGDELSEVFKLELAFWSEKSAVAVVVVVVVVVKIDFSLSDTTTAVNGFLMCLPHPSQAKHLIFFRCYDSRLTNTIHQIFKSPTRGQSYKRNSALKRRNKS